MWPQLERLSESAANWLASLPPQVVQLMGNLLIGATIGVAFLDAVCWLTVIVLYARERRAKANRIIIRRRLGLE